MVVCILYVVGKWSLYGKEDERHLHTLTNVKVQAVLLKCSIVLH